MEIKEFTDKIKEAKYRPTQGAYIQGLKVKTNKEHTRQRIILTHTCQSCKVITTNICEVRFKTPQYLTIFEGELLYQLYCKSTIPHDYMNYHKCIAGKAFIENIERIRTY